MSLGDDLAFYEWLARGHGVAPRRAQQVRRWIDVIAEEPWAAPSVPMPEISDRPDSEIRYLVIPDLDVEVFYKQTYASDLVDLIYVRDIPG